MTSTQPGLALNGTIRRYRSGAGGFLAWWKRSLLDWLPARWQERFGLVQERLLVTHAGDRLQLQWQNLQGLHELAWLPAPAEAADLDAVLGNRLAGLPRWMLLPAGSALQRRMLLPAAAAERLRDVVGFEIDRQTPFTADGVRYDTRVLQRRADGQLEAELVAVPRVRFDAALAGLGGLAASLAGVDACGTDGAPLGVNLLPAESRRGRQDPLSAWNWALAAFALIAVAATAWQVLDNRRASAAAFDAQVESRAVQARVVAMQRQQLVDIVEGAAFLDTTRAARPTTVEVLDELTRRLPNHTHLEKVSMEGDRLLLIGLSPEASALVARMEGSTLWRAPALSGALQPDPRTRLDRFSLTAELIGSPAPTTPASGGGQ
jgi:general secretion pathway protein L